MAENRTLFGHIRDKLARPRRVAPSQTSDPPSSSNRRQDLPSTPAPPVQPSSPSIALISSASNFLPPSLPHPDVQSTTVTSHRETSHPPPSIVGEHVAEAISSVNPGVVNVVGQDQVNVYNHNHSYFHVNRTGENVEEILSNPLFKTLSHVVKASYDASTPALRRACTLKTRTAILEAIGSWAFDVTMPKIYWMNGMAGTGKTTITYSLSIFLKNHNILGGTFFCSRLVDECTKVDRIFPTIAYNLARNYPPLASTILETLKNDPDAANGTINQQLTDLLVKPIKGAAKDLPGQPIVVVIDALDECSNQAEVQTFLSVIFQRSPELPFKIFITSRPEQLVRVGFKRQDPDKYSRLVLHDIERDIVSEDIKLYVGERLVEMVDGRSDFEESVDDWPPEDKVDALVHQSNRLFIYARTICDYIGDLGGNILERLNAVLLPREEAEEQSSDTLDTTELDRLYRDILDRAIPTGPKERERQKRILSAIVNIRNPLSALGLGILLGINPGMIRSSLGSLHAVISVPPSLNSPVSTFHASLPDCLSDSNRSLHHFLHPSESHRLLAKSCLSLMNSSLKENICNIKGRPSNDTITDETITTHVSEGLTYACVYWASHLTATTKEDLRDVDDIRKLLNKFLRDHILHWMECLSLLKKLDVAIDSLRTLEKWALDIYPEMSTMITDAYRFSVENFDVICHYCLETYYSALVWLPIQSIIRKIHATHRRNLPKVTIGLRNAWGSCEKVIICERPVNSVAYSSDDNRIVSGLRDYSVRIWNAITGESEGIFEGHSAVVRSVAFSSDGCHVISMSVTEIRIWNVVTGEQEVIFSGPGISLAFSSDGSHAVTGSDGGEVRIWNVVTGNSEGIFFGHSGTVRSVAFSKDGSHVVSGSEDGTVRIWNVAAGKSERIFVCNSGCVFSVAFSSDERFVVSGSSDGTVQIWNVVTGESEGNFQGHSDLVLSVAFSRDGNRIVSGSYDRTVRLWNIVTGESGFFEGHSNSVSSVAFSSDGSHIVSGSTDCTVRIWNVVTGESKSVFEGRSSQVSSLAFSSDGIYVVSGSDNGIVQMWNVVTGEPEGIFEGHSGCVWCVTFSRDGSHVASWSDGTILVWNVVSGESERIFKGHSRSVVTGALSSDGSHVVSGSYGKIRIWNVVSGEVEGVFRGHSNWVRSVAFSRDGSRVVSGADDGTVRIWNVATGESERTFGGYPQLWLPLVFSSDGNHIMSRSFNETIHIWNMVTGESRRLRLSDETDPLNRQLKTSAENLNDDPFHPHVACYTSDDWAWIRTHSAQRDCWIPQRYRDFHHHYSCGSKMSFGYHNGSVVVVDLGDE